jgi:catechol 2,3-dioxygenase
MRDSLIHPETRIGAVHLTVSDLERSLRFYGDALGFQLLERQDHTATLAADSVTPLLALTGQPDARPKPARSTGLYHFAILVPTRLELARSLRHLADMHYPAQGAADH